MFKEERQNEIMNLLNTELYATVQYLAHKLHTSPSSIRRDLTVLEKKGFLKRSYGGVELVMESHRYSPSFAVHKQKNIEKKRSIAKLAIDLIPNESVVFLDGSSSCYYLAVLLAGRKNVTVISNNIDSVNVLAQSNIDHIYSTGGRVSKTNPAVLTGSFAENMASNIHADFFFFSTLAVSKNGVLSDDSESENKLRKIMFDNSDKRILLCDSNKLGHTSIFSFCTISDLDYVVCDEDISGYFNEQCDKTEFVHPKLL